MTGITTSKDDGVLTITIDRPAVLNALHPPAHAALHEIFDDFASQHELHIAIIRGSGERAFCTGSDLNARNNAGGNDFPPTGFAGLTERFNLDKPVIAAVNGHAIGGGFEIVLACDLAIAVSHAKFGLPEPKIGLAAVGGLHRLARQIPLKQAMEIALTGRLFDANQIKQYGLVNTVVDADTFERALAELIAELKACAPLSLRASKQMMLKGLARGSLQEAFGGEYHAYDAMLTSADAAEGSRAFLEKRAPIWYGR